MEACILIYFKQNDSKFAANNFSHHVKHASISDHNKNNKKMILESWSRKIFTSMTFFLTRSCFEIFSLFNKSIAMTNMFHTIFSKLYFYEDTHTKISKGSFV